MKPKRQRNAPFYGYSVNFKGHTKTLERLFGKKTIDTNRMTFKLWNYIHRHGLLKPIRKPSKIHGT